MFAIIDNISKSLTSIKSKLLLLFFMIVFVLGGISIGSYLSMKSVNNTLNTMVETTILANDIKLPTQEASELLHAYFMNNTEQGQKEIEKKITRISDDISKLKRLVHDDDGLNSLTFLTSHSNNYGEALEKAIDILKNNDGVDTGKQFLAQQNEVKKINGFLNDEIQNLITKELGLYQKQKTNLDRMTAYAGLMILITIIIVGTLTIIGAFIYLSKVIGTLAKVADSAREIADGNLRIKEMKVKSHDEVAVLAQSFNKMRGNLRELIGKTIENSMKVADSAENLKLSAKQSSMASEMIATTIQQVSQGASEQAIESQKTVSVITELLDSNQKVFENALQVLAVAEKATHTAQVGNENVYRLINQIEVIETEIISAQTKSDILKQQSEEIGVILDLINGMVEQTNLLSLNASIEAARAGQYGKGFAVVADEVRKLADGSAKAVGNISELLQKIRHEATLVAEQMVTGVEKVKIGTAIAQETRNAFDLLVNTSNETNAGVNKITGEIQKMVHELKKVTEMSETIAAISEQSSASSQEVASATEEQTASLEEISNAAISLSNMAAELQKIVQRFQL